MCVKIGTMVTYARLKADSLMRDSHNTAACLCKQSSLVPIHYSLFIDKVLQRLKTHSRTSL